MTFEAGYWGDERLEKMNFEASDKLIVTLLSIELQIVDNLIKAWGKYDDFLCITLIHMCISVEEVAFTKKSRTKSNKYREMYVPHFFFRDKIAK